MAGPVGAYLARQRIRSVDPSSRKTVPPPLQVPAKDANGPDCALVSELASDAANKMAAATSSRRFKTRASVGLLARCFPAPAARYACRCSIPLPRSGVAVELTVGICTIDRNPHKTLAADGAGNVSAGRRNLAVGDGQHRACSGLAGAGLGHDCNLPAAVIGVLGERRRGERTGRNRSGTNQRNAVKTHEFFVLDMYEMLSLIRVKCDRILLRRQ